VATVDETAERAFVTMMRDALYPGARLESVELVLRYCRARGLDPMLKPVHIVPMWVKEAGSNDKGSMRDVPLPGIALYRIQAARSGEYGGKSEPEFGPEVTENLGGQEVTFPLWCKVTVRRGNAQFTAKEYWLENYATAGRDTEKPNAMWLKRRHGQISKVAEAQALRMAFPEMTGSDPTAEEMEGKAHEPREVGSRMHEERRGSPPDALLALNGPARPVEEEFPLVWSDKRLYGVLGIDKWRERAMGAVDGAKTHEKLAAWLADNAVHFESIRKSFPGQVDGVREAAEQRLAELRDAAAAGRARETQKEEQSA
jgi:phage recombination protein Bet